MIITPTGIQNLVILQPQVHRDHRGFFMESWREEWSSQLGLCEPFIQDNHARSEAPGVLRGLHFQTPPHTQSKLIWATSGSIYDVAVDLRTYSPTYGQWFGIELNAENCLRLFVPRGFAHGYITLQPGTEVQYKVDAYYAPHAEGGIRFDDPTLNISWPLAPSALSDKDRQLPLLKDFVSPFTAETH